MAAWNELLRRARGQRGLGQTELAALVGVSVETLSLYERGAATPDRSMLLRIARALALDRRAINEILAAAGYEPVPTGRLAQFEAERRGLQYLQQEVDGYAWPCLVVNNRMEILCWNEPARRVAELDFVRDLPTLAERNLFRIAVTPHFEQRLLNWDKAVGEMISTLKGEGADLGDPDEGPLYFAALAQDLARTHPDLFPQILDSSLI